MKIPGWMLRRLMPVWCCFLALIPVLYPDGALADWLQDLEADAVAWMAEEGSPGMAMVIVQNDQVILAKGYGHLSVDPSSPPVDSDTVFIIGSTSKAFASALLAVLADRKLLAWDDRVGKLLPLFQMYDPWVNKNFQVEDLLCHRSGLHMFSLTMMELLDYATDSRVQGIRFQRPLTSFRTAFAYQNCMYISAAKLAESIAGKSWGESLSENIFAPLGMNRTVTTQAAVDEMDNVSVGHLHLTDGLWPIPPDWFWSDIQDKSLAAGALRTTAHDMGQWLRMNLALGKLGNQQIVSEDNMRYLQAPRLLVAPWEHYGELPYWGPMSYCCGAWEYWGLSPQPFLFHDGGAMGSGSAIGFVPGANIGIAVLTNIEAGDGLASDIVWHFYELYFANGNSTTGAERSPSAKRKFLQPGSAQAPASSSSQTPGLPLSRYCGVYSNPAYGKFVVTQSKGALFITMGPHKMRASLVRSSGNEFLAYLPGYPDGYEMTIPMTFKFPSFGKAILETGPITHDPAEVFNRISD